MTEQTFEAVALRARDASHELALATRATKDAALHAVAARSASAIAWRVASLVARVASASSWEASRARSATASKVCSVIVPA